MTTNTPWPHLPAFERTLWSVADIARQGGPKRTRIFVALKSGELPSHKIGGRRYVLRTHALAWLSGRPIERAEGGRLELCG
jgi:hypothetical protein